jgi:hypothetical protein
MEGFDGLVWFEFLNFSVVFVLPKTYIYYITEYVGENSRHRLVGAYRLE